MYRIQRITSFACKVQLKPLVHIISSSCNNKKCAYINIYIDDSDELKHELEFESVFDYGIIKVNKIHYQDSEIADAIFNNEGCSKIVTVKAL